VIEGGSDGPAEPATVSVVVLSQGTRPVELARALDGLLAQRGVALDIVCVGNGWTPVGLPASVRTIALAENVGITAGRNVGAQGASGELIFFPDDDAWIDDPDLLRAMAAQFAADPSLGALQPRIADIDGTTLRRWVPRARVGDPAVSGPAFNLLEGVSLVRRAPFEAVGGWPDAFFYGHEGVDLAWRLWAAGWTCRYDGGLVVHHPATATTRHADFYRLNARNRVWVARRNLPWPVAFVYLGVWTGLTAARLARQPGSLRTWVRGFVEGWRTSAGPRKPMSWRTVWRLTRLGQPPVV
jgi:GT2 family glycosyltransferase